MDAKMVLVACGLAFCLARSGSASGFEPATGPPRDDGDEEYRFLAGLVEQGMYERAVREAERFLTEFPRHPKQTLARYRLATALFELDRRDEAAPHYRRLGDVAGFEYRAEAQFRLGQCELDAGRLREAEGAFAAVAGEEGSYLAAPAGFFFAECAFRGRRFEVAEARYGAWLERFPTDEHAPDARRGLAWCAWEQGDAPRTAQRCRGFLTRHGTDEGARTAADELRVLLGEALLEMDDPRAALEAFHEVRDGAFADAALRGAGFALAALGDHGGAAREFAAVGERFPESRYAPEAALQRGVELLRAGQAAEAVAALRSIAADGAPEALLWLARALEASGEVRAALSTLDRALRASPGPELAGRLHVARGDLLARLDRHDEARVAYERGGSDYALHAAAVSALQGGDPAGAARLAEALFAAYPDTEYRTPTLLVLGEAHFAQGEYDAAEDRFREVIDAGDEEASLAQARSRIAWCRYLAGDTASAARGFAEVVTRHPTAAEAEEAAYMQGRAAREAGDARAAEIAGTAYLERYPDGRWRDEVLFDLGRAAEGRAGLANFARIVEDHPASDLAPAALLELGERLSRDGRHEEAAVYYARLVHEHPDCELVPQARYGRAWCLSELGEHAAAATELEAVGREASAEPSLRIAAGELLVWVRAEAGNAAGASAAWRTFARICAEDARRYQTARTACRAWTARGEPTRALALLDELLAMIEDPPVVVEALVEGAYLALDAGDLDRAEAQVRVARKRGGDAPAVAEASFFVGEARFERGEDDRAAPLYEGALVAGSPVGDRALYKLGFVHLRNSRPAQAETAFARLATEHRESELWGEATFLLGEARFAQAKYEEAAEALTTLRRERPRHEVMPKALFRLGLALGHLERWGACEAALSELARRHGDFSNLAEAELWRGRALAAQGKRRPAQQAFERVVALHQGELAAAARIGIGGLHADAGRDEEALAEFLKVAWLYAHPELVAEALFRAGGCLERQGEGEKAAQQYRRVVEKHGETSFSAAARDALRRLGKQ